MAPFVFDRTTAKVLSKWLSFGVLWDLDDDGKRTNPHVDMPEFSLGGLQWKLVARPCGDCGVCGRENEGMWSAWVKLSEECRRALAHGYEVQVRQKDKLVLTNDTVSLPLFTFGSTLVGHESAFHIKPEDIHPYRLQFVDEAVAKTKKYDCKIILEDDEDKIVFVNKVVLSLTSPFFDKLFFSNSKEKKQKTKRLSDVTEVDFLEYLYCVYPPPNRPLAFKRLEVLLRLADRFQNDVLRNAVETFLAETKEWTVEKKWQALEWADSYRLPTLFAQIVESMDKTELASLDEKKCSKFCELNSAILKKRIADLS